MRVVELADEYELTTAQALDVCERAGLAAADGSSVLTAADVAAFRRVAASPLPAPGPTGSGPSGSFANSVPLPPQPSGGWTSAPAPEVVVSMPSYKRDWPMDSSAVWAMVCAFLPLAILYLGWAGWLFAIPTFVFAGTAKQNIHRHHGERRGGTLAFMSTFIVVMCAVFATVYVKEYNAGGLKLRADQVVDNAIAGRSQPNGAGDKQPTSSQATGGPVVPGGGSDQDPAVGDCVNAKSSRGAAQTLSDVEVVDCVPPHDAEVIESFDVARLQALSGIALDAKGARPPEAQLSAAVSKACRASFVSAVSSSPAGALMTMVLLIPTEAAWVAGHSIVSCAVGTRDGSRLAGSVNAP